MRYTLVGQFVSEGSCVVEDLKSRFQNKREGCAVTVVMPVYSELFSQPEFVSFAAGALSGGVFLLEAVRYASVVKLNLTFYLVVHHKGSQKIGNV